MTQYRLAGPARQDLDAIWDYIAADNPKAADRLLDRFFEKFHQIALQPPSYPVYPEIKPPYQFAVVKRYVIFFRSQADCVEILRITHGARDIPALLGSD